jgi:hypothetical protein
MNERIRTRRTGRIIRKHDRPRPVGRPHPANELSSLKNSVNRSIVVLEKPLDQSLQCWELGGRDASSRFIHWKTGS